jgi:carbon storage regulator
MEGLSYFFPFLKRRCEMLVLSRKKNESIVIDNDITIVVVEIRGDKVRLGVEAPKEVPVHRREVYEAIKRNEAATLKKPATPKVSDATSSEARNRSMVCTSATLICSPIH